MRASRGLWHDCAHVQLKLTEKSFKNKIKLSSRGHQNKTQKTTVFRNGATLTFTKSIRVVLLFFLPSTSLIVALSWKLQRA